MRIVFVLLLCLLVAAFAVPLSIVSQSEAASPWPEIDYTKHWVSMGPSPISNCEDVVILAHKYSGVSGGLCSGRLTAIAIDPANTNVIYVGGAQGGVWKSTNGGKSWIPLTDDQPSLAVGSIVIDPHGNIYVGTGEPHFSGDSYYGAGILKSSDGGSTWIQLGKATFGRSAISKILVDPNNPSKLIVSTVPGAWTSGTVSGYVFPGVDLGIYVSSDGGASWNLTMESPSYKGVSDLVMDPTDSSIIYAGVVDKDVYKSIDGGLTWNSLGLRPFGVGRIALSTSASNHLTVLSAYEWYNSTLGLTVGGLSRTDDGGANWRSLPTPSVSSDDPFYDSFCGKQCYYDLFVAADPRNPDVMYLGGLNLYRSVNGGQVWTDLGGYYTVSVLSVTVPFAVRYLHVDQHTFAFSPSSPDTVYVGNDGGLWYSTNGVNCSPDSCWIDLNNGLGITQFYSLAAHPSRDDEFFGGTQDNGCIMHRGKGLSWSPPSPVPEGGDCVWVAYDSLHPSIMYDSWQKVSPRRSVDGGISWFDIVNGLSNETGNQGQFFNAWAIDTTTTSTLYLGTYSLYKTDDGGGHWFLPSPGLQDLDSFISSIAATSHTYESTLYVGLDNGTFFNSTDGGKHFSRVDLGTACSSCRVPITRIAIDQLDAQRVYVTLSGFDNPHVLMTPDMGSSWYDRSSDLPEIPANVLAVDWQRNLYVGMDAGVYASSNGGASWTRLGVGLPNAAVEDLVFTAGGEVLAATHGRGVWCYPLGNASCTEQSAVITIPSPVVSLTLIGAILGTIVVLRRRPSDQTASKLSGVRAGA